MKGGRPRSSRRAPGSFARAPSLCSTSRRTTRWAALGTSSTRCWTTATSCLPRGSRSCSERCDAVDARGRAAERYLPFLATTASATPFIGLFGTVFGIIAAFHGIGQQGSASLAVVAPGISEALIATAAGLGAAIPAVIGYNYFVNRVKHWATEMDGFSLDLLNLLARTAPKVPRVAKDGV